MEYAVFFMSERIRVPGLEDCSIHAFDSLEAAEQFIADKLVEAAEFTRNEAGLLTWDGEVYESVSDAIDDWHESADPLEFFHAYPLFDQRSAPCKN